MTSKQARNHLWAIEEDIDHGNYLDKLSDEENSKQAKIALQMGADALEKQIPKKPLVPIPNSDPARMCPTCEKLLCFIDNSDRPHHCECGQKIDWSKE